MRRGQLTSQDYPFAAFHEKDRKSFYRVILKKLPLKNGVVLLNPCVAGTRLKLMMIYQSRFLTDMNRVHGSACALVYIT